MSENILATGKRNGKDVSVKKWVRISAIVAAVLMLFGLIGSIGTAGDMVKEHVHSKWCYEDLDDYYDQLHGRDTAENETPKFDCAYADGAFSLGMERYFNNGGILFPVIVFGIGVALAYVSRARNLGYEVTVTAENITITYVSGKTAELPLCSLFSVEKEKENDLILVTSENTYVLRGLEGCTQVYEAILSVMPEVTVKGPANNEQVLGKGYPPAIKPLLMVLMIIVAVATLILTIASEEPAFLLVGVLPFIILLVVYLLAKTPYLVVTDKRVFYVSDFGRKLSLPMNKITVTVTHRWFRQLHICAPTGRIHLFWVKNTAALYDMINAVLNEKQ